MVGVLAMAQQTGVDLAEIAFLLILIAGLWLAASEIPRLGIAKARRMVAAIALAVAGLLLIVATHWGHFG
jgi:hypothetical protein